MVSITGGWLASIRQNTYRQLTGSNPYLFPLGQYPAFYEIRQTKMDEVFGMIKTNIGDHVSATARVSWWQYNNLPMFLNDNGDSKNFYIQYDDQVNALSLQLSARYQISNTFGVGANASFYNYYNKSYDRVWHEPGLRLKADMTYRPSSALIITAYATILDQIYSLDKLHEEVKLDGVFDLGVGAEYSFIPRLSAFININNLLNDRYQRWYGYESYGINVYGGLRLKF
jgi:outer membrane cobalamin receptor